VTCHTAWASRDFRLRLELTSVRPRKEPPGARLRNTAHIVSQHVDLINKPDEVLGQGRIVGRCRPQLGNELPSLLDAVSVLSIANALLLTVLIGPCVRLNIEDRERAHANVRLS
jgi:hypothetical protein